MRDRSTVALGALTLFNTALLAFQLAGSRGAAAESVGAVVRASEIQLVDAQGRMRAQLKTEPAGTANGVSYEETVIFRLITPDGKPRVKLTTAVDGSSLLLLGATDSAYTRLGARGASSTVEMSNGDGTSQTLKP